jgi:hypothetical protein
MTFRALGRLATVAAIALAAAGCGGGGDGGTGGTGVTALNFGTVTDFGSIFVNGVEFSTIGARVTRDDAIVNESELRRGMVVEVQGSMSGATIGTATTVAIEEAVRGRVESEAGTAAAGTIVVLGQTVRVDDRTLFDNSVPDFASLTAGDPLEVHGLRTPGGDIAATYIERKAGPLTFSVRGTVANHNALATTFTIGALTVNYGVAGTIIGDMPAPSGSNWNGLLVEVKGTLCAGGGNPVCGTLTATKVEPERIGVAEAAQAEVEGFVTAFTSSASFRVGTQAIVTNSSTLFLGGDAGEIALGVKLEVEGSLAGGVLAATKVKFKDVVKIESNATASGATITALDGLPGITVTANAFTEFKNAAGATATDLSALNGKSVRIRGRASGANSLIASEIEQRGPADSSDVRLQGFATSVTSPTFVILGVTVNTSALANPAEFKGTNDAPIGSAAFYSAITPNGGLVKARGRHGAPNALTTGELKEVELED